MKKFLVIYFFLIFFALIFLCSGAIDSQDGFQYLAVARNIYYKGKPSAPPEEYSLRKNIPMSLITGRDGDTYSLTGLGYSVALLPAVAITDLVYKIYGVSPPVHFPLESDWLILLTASFTNSFFGALLTITVFLYFIELNISKKISFFLSLVTLFSTNLLVYSKHSFAQMMFTTFLFLSFFFLKKYSRNKSWIFLFLSGISFGIHMITYNQTFILGIIPLAIYYFLLIKPKFNKSALKKIVVNFLFFLIGLLPFIFISVWFENLRAYPNTNLVSSSASSINSANYLLHVPIAVLIEGIYGQLFSSGRSIFIYSPLLLILIIFWHKIKKQIRSELIVFLVLLSIYILFFSSLYSVGGADQGISALWTGESSWGPRYLVPLIPFGMLIVGFIFIRLNKFQKKFIFIPLMVLGIYVELLGILFPYQIKFHDTQINFFINGTNYTNYVYTNLLPRYTPIFTTSKKLIKIPLTFIQSLNHSPYNVRFYDGIDFPFNVGTQRWRTINGIGTVIFDDNKKDSVRKITLGLINHAISESSSTATLKFSLNDKQITQNPITLKISERKQIDLTIESKLLKPKGNKLVIQVSFENPKIISGQNQILGLIHFFVNNQTINKESIDTPYISPLNQKITNSVYENFGGSNTDPWLSWNIHTQIYERTPDFWWIKALYYWDFPKKMYLALFLINLAIISYLLNKTVKHFNK